ncbi:MAG TPA: TetR/AcrR family transcriptional regulator [Thermoleophilaceae bacterium]|nr:TetR/AcrR family transcriptional regulator [Thermoleophilaceae bacterium]
MATRTRLATDERRRQLLELGLEFFGNRPYGDVGTAEVARQAGVSHGLLFHYFGDKRRYYLEVLRWVADELLTAQAAGEDASPWERLQAKLRAQVDFADRYTVGYRALVSGGNGADEELAELAEDARWRSIRLIADALDIDDPPPPLRIALRGWQGFTEGAITEWLKRRDLPVEDLVQLMARELVSTLKRLDVDLAPAKRK